jgi:CP family cyanate transporter-like MFS transporter
MFIVLRSPDSVTAASLSGMSQAVGYCLAAFAPFLFGLFHDLTGGWHASVVMILLILVAMLVMGLQAGRNRLVGVAA